MAKKEPTAKQLAARQAASERLKKMHAEKKAQKEAEVKAPVPELTEAFTQEAPVQEAPEQVVAAPAEPVPQPEPQPAPQPAAPAVAMSAEQFEMLLQRFATMGSEKPQQIQGVGIIERFPLKADNYKDPREELYDHPRFQRFGMRFNFVIDWTVTPTKYETKQGQWYTEPRFELTFKRKQLDDNGDEIVRHDKFGKPFHPRVVLGRASFFIDPPADMLEAEAAGLEDAGLSDEQLRERMMFWRYAMWIEEKLNPRLPEKTTQGLKEEVINGKAYQIEEFSMPV